MKVEMGNYPGKKKKNIIQPHDFLPYFHKDTKHVVVEVEGAACD